MSIWNRRGFRRFALLVALLAVCLAAFGRTTVRGQQNPDDGSGKKEPVAQDPENPFPRRVRAPSLEGGQGWLNSAGPIELSKLKGKVVLLDFWTFCCINCMHILPDLAKLEQEFPNELVVVGVHSAKFDGERLTDNIRNAVIRYEIQHPVVNDAQMRIWRTYGVQAWPTQVLIDPEGYYIGSVSGEGNYDAIREAIQKLITYHDKKGTLDHTPLHFRQERLGRQATPLLYPGKVAVDVEQERLAVADSGHHRLVVAQLSTGKLLATIGVGLPGLADGPFDKAKFFEPQGMAFDGNLLYVADRKNHALRTVDLDKREVRTLAGTGKQGFDRLGSGPARETALSSPWAVLLRGRDLYIAMAGIHQIWKLDLASGTIGPFAGSGRENIYDADLDQAAFAQPSGLAADGTHLFVADSETSSIRKIDLEEKSVETIVGEGLFDFGDSDGVADKARLQHPLGIAAKDGLLYVADTYNNKLKTIDPAKREAKTFLGDGKPELSDNPARFDEPGGLAIAGNRLYVADTNNHAIRIVDLATRKVSTLAIDGLNPPQAEIRLDEFPTEKPREVPSVSIKTPGDLLVQIQLSVPKGQKLNPQAPMSYRIRKVLADGSTKVIAKGTSGEVAANVDIKLVNADLTDGKTLDIALTWFPCDEAAEGVCRIQTDVWRVPIECSDSGGSRIALSNEKR